jgi:hypothetical protein
VPDVAAVYSVPLTLNAPRMFNDPLMSISTKLPEFD